MKAIEGVIHIDEALTFMVVPQGIYFTDKTGIRFFFIPMLSVLQFYAGAKVENGGNMG